MVNERNTDSSHAIEDCSLSRDIGIIETLVIKTTVAAVVFYSLVLVVRFVSK